MLYHNWFYIVL